MPSSQLADVRSFTPAYVGSVATSANDFHTDINEINRGAIQSVKLGIVSFVLRKEWRSPPVFRDFIPGQAHCDTRVDSMRRRVGRDIPP